jgi:hypothetical protein
LAPFRAFFARRAAFAAVPTRLTTFFFDFFDFDFDVLLLRLAMIVPFLRGCDRARQFHCAAPGTEMVHDRT